MIRSNNNNSTSPPNVNEIERVDGVSIQRLTQIYNKALEAVDEDCPPDIDHRKEDNPYKSKYGEQWQTHLKASVALSPYVCVTDIILYMCAESKRLMEGTVHNNDWYFYHDALTQITARETKEWMRQTYFDVG